MYTPAIVFTRDKLKIVDQTRLPRRLEYIELNSISRTCTAIRELKIRGAPALGIVAAYSLYLAARKVLVSGYDLYKKQLERYYQQLLDTRPTAINLKYALDRMRRIYMNQAGRSISQLNRQLLAEAREIHRLDRTACDRIGEHGLSLLPNPCNILTHCNTGSLATGGRGTALGIIYTAVEKGYKVHVYVPETRPLGQGGRLTYWELLHNKIPCTLIVDSCAGFLMQQHKVDMVIFGADRIACNGDVANKIGSYSLAVLARAHHVPCYAAAPLSTFDPAVSSGKQIPIEERDGKEILQFYNYNYNLLRSMRLYNPAFDITPERLLSGIITDRGILKQPLAREISKIFK